MNVLENFPVLLPAISLISLIPEKEQSRQEIPLGLAITTVAFFPCNSSSPLRVETSLETTSLIINSASALFFNDKPKSPTSRRL